MPLRGGGTEEVDPDPEESLFKWEYSPVSHADCITTRFLSDFFFRLASDVSFL